MLRGFIWGSQVLEGSVFLSGARFRVSAKVPASVAFWVPFGVLKRVLSSEFSNLVSKG